MLGLNLADGIFGGKVGAMNLGSKNPGTGAKGTDKAGIAEEEWKGPRKKNKHPQII